MLVSAPPWEPPPLDGGPSPGLGASRPGSSSAPFASVCFHGPAPALPGSPLKIYCHRGAHTADATWGSPLMVESSKLPVFLTPKGQRLHRLARERNNTSMVRRCLKSPVTRSLFRDRCPLLPSQHPEVGPGMGLDGAPVGPHAALLLFDTGGKPPGTLAVQTQRCVALPSP